MADGLGHHLFRKSGEYRGFQVGDALHLEHVDAEAGEQAMSVDAELLVGRIYRVDFEYDEAAEAMRIYVNGRLAGEQTGISEPPAPGESDLLFGSRNGEDRFEKGGLDKVRVRSEALGGEAILAEYREESETIYAEGFEMGDLSKITEPQEKGGSLAVVKGPPAPPEGEYQLEATVEPKGERAELRIGHIIQSHGDDAYYLFKPWLKTGFAPTGWGAAIFQSRQEEEPAEEGADSPLVGCYLIFDDPEDPESPLRFVVAGGPVKDIGVPTTIFWKSDPVDHEHQSPASAGPRRKVCVESLRFSLYDKQSSPDSSAG